MHTRRLGSVVFMMVCLLVVIGCTISISPIGSRNEDQFQDQPQATLELWADSTTINEGECTTLHWNTNWAEVWMGEKTYQPQGQMQVCPLETTHYEVEIGDQFMTREVIITVQEGSSEPMLEFWADRTTINQGECTNLHWRTNWGGVWIGDKNYSAEGQLEVCPLASTQYEAEIGDQVLTREIVITVQGGNTQQQPAQQQSVPQQPAPPQPNPPQQLSQPKTLEIVGGDSCGWNGDPFTIKLSAPVKVNVWAGNIPAKVTSVSSDGLSVTFIVPSGIVHNHVEVRGEGFTAYKLFNLLDRGSSTFSTDLAVTDLFADNMPRGKIYARLTNRGPIDIINSKVTLDCKAVLKPKSGSSSGWDDFIIKQSFPMVTLAHNETKTFYTGIENQSDLYSYLMTCIATPTDGSFISNYCNKSVHAGELQPGNNTYSEDIPFFFQ